MLKEIIKSSPDFIEKPARYLYMSIPDSIRYGSAFRKKYEFLKESQWWTKEKQEEYQMKQTTKLLNHAYANVPYYTRVFDERGIKPKNIQNFNDLKLLPYLTKEIIRENLQELTAVNYKKSQIRMVTTGGTTMIPLSVNVDAKLDKAVEWAFIANLWNRVGYNIKKINRFLIIRGNIPQNGLYEYKGRDLIFSSYKLTEENMKLYLELLEDFNPDYIQAYPSSIHIFSKYILKNNIKVRLNRLKGIFCSSENLYDYQRPDIEQAFGVRVFSFYGHTEHSCLAGECEKSNNFHLQSEYGYTEIINELGEDVWNEEGIGEMVVTGFNNYVVPFIRYKTGDLVVTTKEKCECGRDSRMIKKIEGRKQDYFVNKNGDLITFIASSNDVLRPLRGKFTLHQFVQNEPGKATLKIQNTDVITEEDIIALTKRFCDKFPGMELEVNTVENIERTRSGKLKFLVQNIGVV